MDNGYGNGICHIPFIGVSVAERVPVMRRAFSDVLLSVCALGVLLAALVAFDGRIRDEVAVRMNGARASTELVAAGTRARSLAAVVVEVAKDQSQQHRPLMMFVVAATVLTLFMVRT
jgi:hypothetical protein